MKNFKKILFYIIVLLYFSIYSYRINAETFIDTPASFAYIVDFDSGAVLLDKNSNMHMPPASMSKLMTIYLVFEALRNGNLELSTELPVSEKAWNKRGSRMFVEYGTTVSVEDLLRGIIVQSGNDACIVIAEGLSGTEEAFVDEMNRTADRLGLYQSNFSNSTGWPDDEHYMSPKDLSILTKRIIIDFPDYFPMFAEKSFKYNNIKQGNRNPLLFSKSGADGMKTGFTEGSKYGLVATATRNNRRVIMVLNGIENAKKRASESNRLLNWAFRQFENIVLFSKNETVTEAGVWLGYDPGVSLITKDPITVTIPRKTGKKNLLVKAAYVSPIKAPIYTGKQYAKLIVENTANGTNEYPLYAKNSVERSGLFKRMISIFSYLIFGLPIE